MKPTLTISKTYELNIILKDIPIYVIVKKNIDFLIEMLEKYSKKKKLYLSIDFEFNNINNKRTIALWQMDINNEIVFVFNPDDMNSAEKGKLIDFITQENTIKYMHGSESLDMHFLLNEFFTNYRDKINFLKNFYDTKFLCEYYKIIKNTDNKCKIYYILLHMKVINNKQFNLLLENQEEMGDISKLNIDVNNLNINLLQYSVYDVIYLKKLVSKFKTNKIEIINDFLKMILINKEKIKLTNDNLNRFNLNYINVNKKKIKLYEIVDYYSIWLNDNSNIVLNFMDITFYKKTILLLTKYIIYKVIASKYNVYYKDSNNNINEAILSKYDNYFGKINFFKYYKHVNNLIEKLEIKLKNDIMYFV